MKILLKFIAVVALSALLFSCREAYTPPAITTASNYLVVEGIINTKDSTIIKLSRTVSLNAKTITQNETHAQVSIESDGNDSYPLKETTPGTYVTPPLGLSITAKYRLRIITNTNNHATYLSDFVPVKQSPPVDSVGYIIQPNGLQIYLNTHDATNNTRYYRWGYTETWDFNSAFASYTLVINDTNFVRRTPAQDIFTCWASAISDNIILASSAKLTQDVIYQTPINFVPSTSEKVSLGYSILITQYALTQDAFNYWQNLKTNTENLGSIFDAQPSEMTGNIHNIANGAEPVVGYISAGPSQQKRITVLNRNWPVGWGVPGHEAAYGNCTLDTVPPPLYPSQIFYGGALQIPVTPIVIDPLPPPDNPPPDTIGFIASSRQCVDCTYRGTNKRPSYWPF